MSPTPFGMPAVADKRQTAEYLLSRGADLNWIGHDRKTPLQAAHDSEAKDVIMWLVSQGAKPAQELG